MAALIALRLAGLAMTTVAIPSVTLSFSCGSMGRMLSAVPERTIRKGPPRLIAIGVGGRRIVGMVTPPAEVPGTAPEPSDPGPSESGHDQSNN
ncbi:hypothetical protein GCM10017674_24520 [Streptomyces gardneri]|uniref:Uncharacterized protein n=1 Tax=Streptomyces gardneri TaxID=66892 RepID=A0A4Y3RRI5_9ACTN|nr:hypothetical protein SGA01_52630 [Streptomyces gardneri]GHG94194.1 hypothetical protein GCM10017674_24520 [Streptomyces gardneri]